MRVYLRSAFAGCLGLLLSLAAGCGSQPIPTVAVTGSTATVVLPREFSTGYGMAAVGRLGALSVGGSDVFDPTVSYDSSSKIEDPQRGEMVFELVTLSGVHVAYLPVRYITRMGPSELSPLAEQPDTFALNSLGVAIAMVDIPSNVPAPLDYKIKLTRYVRNETTLEFEPLPEALGSTPWYGWGNGGDPSGIPIRIEAGDGSNHFTPYNAWTDFFGNLASSTVASTTNMLKSAVPRPFVSFAVAYTNSGGTDVVAPAWEAELTYPRKKLAIRNVGLGSNLPSRAMVSHMVMDPEPVDCNDGADTGTLRLLVLDPEARHAGVRIAFELLNFDQACGGRAAATDFQVVPGSLKAYDLDGNAQTPISTVSDSIL